ncbi:endocuticle structural glycoprotein SgAbd-8-like [Planococcus citri]|uniref:endocuticle structural glycoprotein SgAbd-8-like n=1 Tax=Planococcus citri TaxID=170843 RepID=UPI0031F7FC75
MCRITLFLLASLLIVQRISSQSPPAAAPGPQTTPIPIIKYENPGVNFDGSYKWSYETGNSIVAEESGYLLNPGSDQEAQHAEGSYSYTAPDGTLISVTYVAGPEGFVPQGAHLPTPPPVPEAIAKALEYIRSLPPSPEDNPTEQSSSPAPKTRRHYRK